MKLTLMLFFVLTGIAAADMGNNQDCKTIYPKDGPVYSGNYGLARGVRTDKKSVRIVSYNVNYLDSPEAILKDLTENEELRNADFIVVQEVTGATSGEHNQIDGIARALKMNYVFSPGGIAYWLDPQRDYGNAVLSRWPITSVTKVLLPLSGKENCNQRTAVGVIARVGERPIQVFSVHLSTQFPDTWGGERSRAAQFAAAFEQMNLRKEIPAYIGGDLNTVNPMGLEKLEKMVASHKFIDAHRASDSTHRKHNVVIDRAYARGLIHEADGTVTKAQASDHFPIWSQLTFSE